MSNVVEEDLKELVEVSSAYGKWFDDLIRIFEENLSADGNFPKDEIFVQNFIRSKELSKALSDGNYVIMSIDSIKDLMGV